eukprot:536445-Pelagomonas_calceolata.AAC.7
MWTSGVTDAHGWLVEQLVYTCGELSNGCSWSQVQTTGHKRAPVALHAIYMPISCSTCHMHTSCSICQRCTFVAGHKRTPVALLATYEYQLLYQPHVIMASRATGVRTWVVEQLVCIHGVLSNWRAFVTSYIILASRATGVLHGELSNSCAYVASRATGVPGRVPGHKRSPVTPYYRHTSCPTSYMCLRRCSTSLEFNLNYPSLPADDVKPSNTRLPQ